MGSRDKFAFENSSFSVFSFIFYLIVTLSNRRAFYLVARQGGKKKVKKRFENQAQEQAAPPRSRRPLDCPGIDRMKRVLTTPVAVDVKEAEKKVEVESEFFSTLLNFAAAAVFLSLLSLSLPQTRTHRHRPSTTGCSRSSAPTAPRSRS